LIGEKSNETLTCRKCNNALGTKYQRNLKHFLIHQLHAYGKYGGSIPGYIHTPDTRPLRSNIIFTPGSLVVTGVPKANDPLMTQAHVTAWDDIAAHHIIGYRFSITLEYSYKLPIAWAAYLQAAYLTEYIFSDGQYTRCAAGRELRTLVASNRLTDLGPCLIEPLKIGVGGKPWQAAITEPENLRCLWVKVAGNIVVLPWPDDSKLSCYTAWQAVCDQTSFGLKPKTTFRLNFWSVADAIEANKCLPGLLARPSGDRIG